MAPKPDANTSNLFLMVPLIFLNNITNMTGFKMNKKGEEINLVKLVYPPKYAIRMYCSSHLAILCTLYSGYHGMYDIAFINFMVSCCSLNYWNNPCFGIRRTMDIVFCQVALWYTFYLTYAYLPRRLFLVHVFGMSIYITA
eukprot:360140_1